MGKNSVPPRNFSVALFQLRAGIHLLWTLSLRPTLFWSLKWMECFVSISGLWASFSLYLSPGAFHGSRFYFRFWFFFSLPVLSLCSFCLSEACIPARNKCWFYPSLKFLIFIQHPNMAVGSGLYDSHIFVQGQPALHHLFSNCEFPLGPPIVFSFPVCNLLWANMLGPDLLKRNDWQSLCSMTDQIFSASVLFFFF